MRLAQQLLVFTDLRIRGPKLVALEFQQGPLPSPGLGRIDEQRSLSEQIRVGHPGGLIALDKFLVVAVCVEERALAVGVKQRAAFVLAVGIDQQIAQLLQGADGHGQPVCGCNAAAVGGDPASQDEIVVFQCDSQDRLDFGLQPRIRDVENRRGPCLGLSRSNHLGRCPFPEHQSDGCQEQGLAGPGLSSPDAEAGLQLDSDVFDGCEILDRQLAEHVPTASAAWNEAKPRRMLAIRLPSFGARPRRLPESNRPRLHSPHSSPASPASGSEGCRSGSPPTTRGPTISGADGTIHEGAVLETRRFAPRLGVGLEAGKQTGRRSGSQPGLDRLGGGGCATLPRVPWGTAPMARFGIGLLIASLSGLASDDRPEHREDFATVRPIDREAADFFEARIRPVLVERCVECHGPEKQKGGLRLDSAAALRKGGETGPVLDPDDPDSSPLVLAVRYDDLVQMPPSGKLPDPVIADLTRWVHMGAPWPEVSLPASVQDSADSASGVETHWAFQPVQDPPVPEVNDRNWPATSIDRFVLQGLERAGLRPSPPADKRTLIRRASFDLTGLPPTPEEVEEFLADDRPDAFARVVDRLLASPRYGERWGRHWLDLARYADTKGYVYDDRELGRFPFSYTYRDYVIRSFNRDLPYDRFLREQLAADLLPDLEDRSSLAALGFLTLGRRFLGNVHDIIDDRLDVVFRSTQALTISCARCHDHKYDPIPIADYYSLYGVFAGTTERTVRLGDPPADSAAVAEYERGLRQREEALERALEAERAALSDRLRSEAADYLVAVLDADRLPGEEHYLILAEGELNPLIVHRWRAFLLQTREGFHPIFGAWHAFAELPAAQFSERASAVAARLAAAGDAQRPLNRHVRELFQGPPPQSMAEVARRYGELFATTHRQWQELLRAAAEQDQTPPAGFPDPELEAIRQVIYAADAPTTVPSIHLNQIEAYFSEPKRVQLGKLQMEIDRWHIRSPTAAPHALILSDRPTQSTPHVFLRGNPKAKGPAVPRQFLAALSSQPRTPFRHGSGRLELADCIANPNNPLTARVMVNRIWMHHFGEGLVRTPSDFGTRGEPPSHPELLDHLARLFVSDGWSVKSLHRRIMLSRTYQQASSDHPEGRSRDPENRLLWRMNRLRLEWEALRDAMLAVSGRLESSLGGPPVPLTMPPFPPRRAVYGFIDRRDLPGVFRVFNMASADQHTPRRHETTIPQQALFLMNNPFVIEQARALASNPEVRRATTDGERIQVLYRTVLQRRPTDRELEASEEFLSAGAGRPPVQVPSPSPWRYGSGVFDAAGGRLSAFVPLPHWTGEAWQAGPPWPDPDCGLPRLTRDGGLPGPGPAGAAVRRWVSPIAGTVAITGTIRHAQPEGQVGDGILAVILSERHGVLGRWEVHRRELEAVVDRVQVEPGEAIDFIVLGRDNPQSDEFTWSPRLRRIEPNAEGDTTVWSALADFTGPPPEPLTPIEQLAQVLLLCNEFTFVD